MQESDDRDMCLGPLLAAVAVIAAAVDLIWETLWNK